MIRTLYCLVAFMLKVMYVRGMEKTKETFGSGCARDYRRGNVTYKSPG